MMRTKVSSAAARVYFAILLAFTGVSIFAFRAAADSGSADSKASSSAASGKAAKVDAAVKAHENLPIAFEKNEGQSVAPVQYVAHGDGFELFLTSREALLALRQPAAPDSSVPEKFRKGAATKSEKVSEVAIEFDGANPATAISGKSQLIRETNYFIGNNPKNWVTDVPSYSSVQYKGLYPGVDAIFYGNQQRLEYDFVVAPGADPKQIALHLDGARDLRLDADGDLVIALPGGSVELLRPVVYQDVNGTRKSVSAGYRLGDNNRVEFAIAGYDASRSLVIDPVLTYSTFLSGGTNGTANGGDIANGVAVDAAGDAFVTGQTFNASFPTGTTVGPQGPPDPNAATVGAAFVSEINPAGTAELYFSYLSGDGGDTGIAIALDPATAPNSTCMNGAVPSVCVYVTGTTFSDNFPTTSSAYNNSTPPNTSGSNVFLAKLNPYVAGSGSLVYSTYLASTSSGDQGFGVAVDAHQNAYVTGIVFASPGAPPAFPILHAAQATLSSGAGNAYLTAISTTTSGTGGLLYSTYLGGNGANANGGFGDAGEGVVVDASGIAYIAGFTTSTDFPSIASTGTFPSIKGYSALPSGNTLGAAFVSAVNTTLTGAASLPYSTYLGGSSTSTPDLGGAIALAGSGVVYVTGQTSSSDFPVSESGSTTGQFPSPADSAGVAFITKLDTTTTISPPPATPPYSVLLGGNGGEFAFAIATDTLGKVVVAGATASTDFPVTPGAFQPVLTPSSVGDGFISKVDPTVPGGAGLLYSTYFGGLGNPTATPSPLSDEIVTLALGPTPTPTSVYVAGKAFSGTNFPIFPSGAFQNTYPSGAYSASFVANLNLIPTVTVSPTSLTFTGGVVGIASAAQTVTLTNNTSSGVVVGSVLVVAGTPAASATDFAISSNTCTGTIAAGGNCTVGVKFTPSVTTTETATLTFTDTIGANPAQTQTVSLTGSGTSAASSTVTVLPATLTFTSQTVNTSSTAQTVTVTNTGNTPVTMGSTVTSLSGTNPGDFSVANTSTCTASLVLTTSGAGASCTINVVFTPTATGSRTATLSVADNATGNPQTVSLTGTGAALTNTVSVLPATLTFSSQNVGTASSAMTVTVTNTGGTPVTLGATYESLGGTNPGDFSLANTSTCSNSKVLATSGANASCVINIVFTPAAAGSRTATLSVTDTATGSPQTVSLSGTGTTAGTPDFSLTPSTQNVSVAPGANGSFTIAVVGINGFTSAVSFSCTGAPRNSTCVTPAAVNASPSPGTSAAFGITTRAFVPPPTRNIPPASPKQLVLLAGALSLLLLLPWTRRFGTRLGLAGAMAVFLIVAGCSGTPPTPAGTYTLTVTGTSGSLTHTATVSLTVQ